MNKVEPLIYATGCFLRPIMITGSDGQQKWVWVVVEFESDSYRDGEAYNPKHVAPSLESLIEVPEE